MLSPLKKNQLDSFDFLKSKPAAHPRAPDLNGLTAPPLPIAGHRANHGQGLAVGRWPVSPR